MNIQASHPSTAIAQQIIDTLLGHIAREHYQGHTDIRFHRHRRALTHAICWPATWFKEKNIHICDSRYQAIIEQRLSEITTHAAIHKTQAYFPNYLLKCLQNHFLHRGDSIYSLVIGNNADLIFSHTTIVKTIFERKHRRPPAFSMQP